MPYCVFYTPSATLERYHIEGSRIDVARVFVSYWWSLSFFFVIHGTRETQHAAVKDHDVTRGNP